jgi:cysteine desulfuration protein SufE
MKDACETTSFQSCLTKQKELKELFKLCLTRDEKYQKIIELGRNLPLLPAAYMTAENTVSGCQSVMYLHSSFDGEKIYFTADSEALISKGLAALMIFVYSGETPEVVLTCPPLFLEKLDIPGSLTPSRANGLASLFLRMKQDAMLLIKN